MELNERQFYKLKKRVEELPEIKTFLETTIAGGVAEFQTTDGLTIKKMKENQNMTALINEMNAFLKAGNTIEAQVLAHKVLDAKVIEQPAKFVKTNQDTPIQTESTSVEVTVQ
jgi:hypothetical protein